MKLRTFAVGCALALTCAGLVTGGALIITTDYLQEAAGGIRESVESIYAAEELQTSLLLHNRSLFLAGLTGEPQYKRRANAISRRVGRLLTAVRSHVATPREDRVCREAEAAVHQYFAAHRDVARRQSTPLDSYVMTREVLEHAQSELEDLVAVNRDQADALTKEVAYHNRLANGLGSVVIILLLLGVGGVLLLGWRFLHLPMLSLHRGIVAYAQRQANTRVTPAGVTEILQIAEAFNGMADSLDRHRANQLRFLASIAHDLRNPLGAIRMSSELLRPDSGVPDAKRSNIADIIQRQATALERLIEDLLDTARIEDGKLDVRPRCSDARDLVREAAVLFQAFSPSHPIEATVPESPVWCDYDRQRMSQVLNNLVSNAIKYSPHGGTVKICAYRQHDAAVIAVRDEGIGIQSADRQGIFEPFRRTAATRDTIPGVGLGLSVSRRIVEAHGGHIELDSQLGSGSTFKVVLPAGAPRSP